MSNVKLDDARLSRYEEILLAKKKQATKLVNEIMSFQGRGAKNGTGDLSSYSIHQADQGTDTDYSERQVYLLGLQQKKIKALNEAIICVHEKTYGLCQICGDYIPEARLKVLPFAKYCMKCKEKEEKRQRR